MKLIRVLRNLVAHPLSQGRKINTVVRFFKWQIGTKLNPYPVVYNFVGDSKLIIEKGMGGATGHVYTGLFEFHDMAFVLHFLRDSDLFVDIGANVGSYAVLASAVSKAKSIAIEPVPSTFGHLLNNVAINKIQDKVDSKNIGLGSTKGKLKFTTSQDAVNHVVSEGENSTDYVEVNVDTLDNVLNNNQAHLIKIDVEGFETEVLKGAEKTLKNDQLKGIIIELNGSGDRYGYDENAIHESLLGYGFLPYAYDPFSRNLTELKTYGEYNTLYLRDLNFVKNRIQQADKISLLGKEF